MTQEEKIQELFTRLCGIFKLKNFSLKFMRRQLDEQGRGVLNLKRGYNLAHANLKNRIITIDIYTPKFRRPKAINSILRILAHEIAHFQKPPYRQRFRGRMIIRQHYPLFYKQVNRNIAKIKKYKLLGKYFGK
jgi:hypothetical protein